ncbi:hypothetical protein PXW27_26535, partial [Klebsiella pneumoniae]|uniref:hypothetical protein n=1 Tax=Klebsiella pneumoniae TaxID=573 RepID=UPI002380EC59
MPGKRRHQVFEGLRRKSNLEKMVLIMVNHPKIFFLWLLWGMCFFGMKSNYGIYRRLSFISKKHLLRYCVILMMPLWNMSFLGHYQG